MSTEEIINAWKNNEDETGKQREGEQPAKGKQTPRDQKKSEGKVPSNPAGEQELTDQDLEAVEGGRSFFTCNAQSC